MNENKIKIVPLGDYENQPLLQLYSKSWWYRQSRIGSIPGLFIGGGEGKEATKLFVDLNVFLEWLEENRKDVE